MDGKNEEILGVKDANKTSSGYFSTVFARTASHEVLCKDSPHADLYWTLNKSMSEGRLANAQSSADRKSEDSPIEGQLLHKDGKPVYPVETTDISYFGSSVHYGGRDFVASSPSKKASDMPKNLKTDEGDDLSNSSMASRGDWWQGSLYY